MIKDIVLFILIVVTSCEIGYLINKLIEDRRKNEIKKLCDKMINKLDEMSDICNEMKNICEHIASPEESFKLEDGGSND